MAQHLLQKIPCRVCCQQVPLHAARNILKPQPLTISSMFGTVRCSTVHTSPVSLVWLLQAPAAADGAVWHSAPHATGQIG